MRDRSLENFIIEKYSKLVGYGLTFSKDIQLVEDVVQDVFLYLWSRSEEDFKEIPDWLFYLAVKHGMIGKLTRGYNTKRGYDPEDFLNTLERQEFSPELEDFLYSKSEEIKHKLNLVLEALGILGKMERRMMELRLENPDEKLVNIAERMNIKFGNAKVKLHEIRSKLEEFMVYGDFFCRYWHDRKNPNFTFVSQKTGLSEGFIRRKWKMWKNWKLSQLDSSKD